MSREEEATLKLLRLTHEAENAGAISLGLSHIDSLYQLPQELERPTSLRELDSPSETKIAMKILAAEVRDNGDLVVLAGAGVSTSPPTTRPNWTNLNNAILKALFWRVGIYASHIF